MEKKKKILTETTESCQWLQYIMATKTKTDFTQKTNRWEAGGGEGEGVENETEHMMPIWGRGYGGGGRS